MFQEHIEMQKQNKKQNLFYKNIDVVEQMAAVFGFYE